MVEKILVYTAGIVAVAILSPAIILSYIIDGIQELIGRLQHKREREEL